MNLTLKTKLLLTIGMVFLLSFAVLTGVDYVNLPQDIVRDRLREARDIRGILMATWRVYHHQFLESGVSLNDKTIGFMPAHALSKISRDFSNWSDSGMTFNSVSDRSRNPRNAADEVELVAIAYFQQHPEVKERMVPFTDKTGRAYYHFSMPIHVEEYCLKCHGAEEDAPATIQELYDTSFDYQVGELRGIMSIKLPVDEILATVHRYTLKNGIVHLVTFLIAFFAIFWLLHKTLLSRMEGLLAATNKVADGDYDVHAPSSGQAEFNRVATSFNRMAAAVSKREEKLRASEAWTKGIINAAGEGIIVIDGQGRIRAFNPAAEELFGYGEEELLERTLDRLMPEDIREAHRSGLARCVSTGEYRLIGQGRTELEGLHRNGGRIELEMSLSDMRVGGELLFLGILRDVAERNRLQNLAAYYRENLQTILDRIDGIVYVSDLDTYELLFANQHCRKAMGRPEVAGQRCWEYLQEGQTGPCDFCTNDRLRDRDGEPTGVYVWEYENTVNHHWYECRDQLIQWMGGRTVRMEVALDITRRKTAERELRERDAIQYSLLSSTGEGIMGIDRDGICTFCNPAAVRLLGYSAPTDLMGKDIHPMIHLRRKDGSDYPKSECRMRGVIHTGNGVFVNDEELWRADGSSFPVEYRSYPVRDGDEITGAVVSFEDITQRRQAEQELEEKVAELEEFNRLAVGRELKMVELKKEINVLLREQGLVEKYKVVE
ncbi:MAG: PAS domain S-box protein [Gammaproteobacteria bacterium]|nr:PAS domain S-box protein [Gammaproteobacteria bacterium]